MPTILEVKNLTKTFGKTAVVDDISFTLQEGEILGMLGSNGAGKTTIIQMLLGVLAPTNGEILYFGKRFQEHREEILEHVNFSSTYTNLPWLLTVKENLTTFAYMYRIKNRAQRVQKIASVFKLEDIYDMQIQELSAGQITRVNLAKAFLNFPKILLLDEPTASLDPDIASYIRDFLVHQRKEFQVSIIITSHNMAEVEEMCDRVIFIDQGKVIADDTPENLAQSLEVSHVELMMRDGLKRTVEYCEEQKLRYKTERRFITIDVKEKAIPEILRGLMDRGIMYDEISIEKPTLEDYFISVTHHAKPRQDQDINSK